MRGCVWMAYRFWLTAVVCAAGCTLETSPILPPPTERGPATVNPVPGVSDGDVGAGAAGIAGDPGAPEAGGAPVGGMAAPAPVAGTGGDGDDGEAVGAQAGMGEPSKDAAGEQAGAAGEEAAGDGAVGGGAGEPATDPVDPSDPPAAVDAGVDEPAPPVRFASSCSEDTDCAADEACMRLNVGVPVSYCAQVCDADSDCEPAGADDASAPICAAGPDGHNACSLPCDLVVVCPTGMVCVPDASSLVDGRGTCAFF